MRIFSILFTLSTLILGCKKKNSQIDPQSQCLTPTEVKIQHISGQEVSFALVGTDSASVGKVSWTIISKEKTVQIETTGKTQVTQSFSQSGEFRVTAVVNTTCQSKVTLTRSENIKIEQYQLQWVTDIGPYLDSTLWTLTESPNGGCLAVGSAAYPHTIVSIDPNGKILWQKELKDSHYEKIRSIVRADDGGYILGGDWYDREYRYGLTKISEEGKLLWEKSYRGLGNPYSGQSYDRFTKVINAMDNGYLIAGYSSSQKGSDKSESPKNANAPQDYTLTDYWIIKVDAQGNKLWDKTIGGKEFEYLSNIIATSDGGYLLSGTSYSRISGDKTTDYDGQYDTWWVKISNSGAIEWDKSIGSTTDWTNQIVGLPDGSTIIMKQPRNGSIVYSKFNISGGLIWEKTVSGSDATILNNNDGGFMMIGQLAQDNFITFSNDGIIQQRKKIDFGGGNLSWRGTGATKSKSGGLYGILFTGKNKSIFHIE